MTITGSERSESMIARRCHEFVWALFDRPMRIAALVAPLLLGLCSVPAARAEVASVKIMMDWIIQGTHAPFFIAQQNGYFKSAGVTVDTIDAGKGATNVAVSVASGVYQFGWGDMPTMIKFNAQNPASGLIAVFVSFGETPPPIIPRQESRS